MRKILPPLLALAGAVFPAGPALADAANPVCPEERAFFDPGNGEDIVVPKGFKVEVFASGLNFPTDVAFLGGKHDFRVLVLESGTGLPSQCNDNTRVPGIPKFDPRNPFTPGLFIYDRNGRKLPGPLGQPTPPGGGFPPAPPATRLSLE